MITLIICALNEEAELPTALRSLSRQKIKDFRLILVNNGSTDKTCGIMGEFSSKNYLETVVLDQPAIGKLNALNTGLKLAITYKDTDVIAFSDADSVFEPLWSEKVFSFFKTNPGSSFGYSTEMFKEDRLSEVVNFKKLLGLYTKMLFRVRKTLGGYMNLGNCYVRRQAFVDIGGFDNWNKSLDTLLTLKLVSSGFRGGYCDAKILFSPRRILDNNILRWCNDEDIRKSVLINGCLTWKPVRINTCEYAALKLSDTDRGDILKFLTVRSERLFRRLLILTVFETSELAFTSSKLKNFLTDSPAEKLLSKWSDSLENIRVATFSQYKTTIERYAAVDRLTRLNWNSLIKVGGSIIKSSFLPHRHSMPESAFLI